MDTTDSIDTALSQAGHQADITPELIKLDSNRITSDSDAPEEEFLFKMSGTPCFPRGDLTTVTGPAKSGKTYFISMLMACAVRHEVLELERIREEPLKVLWYDTEQSRYTTKRILVNRVGRLLEQDSFPDEQFYVFNVRNRTTEERIEYLTQALETYQPDICIIDGIADLLEDINNGPKSQEVMMRLLSLATELKCNITSIIHLNRSGEKLNLRGWIGTVMVQKSYEVFNCDRDNKTAVFTATHTFSRRFSNTGMMYFEIDDNGLPKASDANRHSGNAQGWSSILISRRSTRNSLTKTQPILIFHGTSAHCLMQPSVQLPCWDMTTWKSVSRRWETSSRSSTTTRCSMRPSVSASSARNSSRVGAWASSCCLHREHPPSIHALPP